MCLTYKMSMRRILFLHCFTSSVACGIVNTLREELEGTDEIVAPDIPLHPTAADILSKLGYKVVNLEGGIIEWMEDGLPVISEQEN